MRISDWSSDVCSSDLAIGYPVMIKASAGGGGKGMRIARSEAEVCEGLRSARNEARASFRDQPAFTDKYIEQPRPIEVQVMADTHGTPLHSGEREWSIQRRDRKSTRPNYRNKCAQRMPSSAATKKK